MGLKGWFFLNLASFSAVCTHPAKELRTSQRTADPMMGLTLLGDELLPNGIAEIEPGIDHFYAAPDIEVKLVALANVVTEML